MDSTVVQAILFALALTALDVASEVRKIRKLLEEQRKEQRRQEPYTPK